MELLDKQLSATHDLNKIIAITRDSNLKHVSMQVREQIARALGQLESLVKELDDLTTKNKTPELNRSTIK